LLSQAKKKYYFFVASIHHYAMRNHDLHSPLSKATCLWLVLFFLPLYVFSQTTNISGVVNTYHRVIDVIPSKACVRVSSTAGLASTDKVLLIQMKGATLDLSSNSPDFGNVTSLVNAGNYEAGTICAIIGDSVFLVNDLLNSYTASTGKVQLVKFGEYVSANVTGPVTAAPWNNTTGTGGVIAIFAEQDITLNEDIDADAGGFRGGAFALSNTWCNNSYSDYFYNGTPSGIFGQSGAYKGESISDISTGVNGGRGALGSAGGGGNNHNNGGGGGSNLSTGGRGGGNSTNPSISSCNASYPGEGGKALNSAAGTKIFFGGGGGAGHNNNALTTTPGGNGGGIIFIRAANLISNGREITASGGIGGNSQADGAGGGGGGGTIILDIATYTGAVTIKADGGRGGDSDDQINDRRCYGAGGGGGGGAVYFSGASPGGSITANAGAAGLEFNRDPNCATPVFPAAGTNGSVTTGYTYRASTTLASYCGVIILPVRLTYFKATTLQKTVNLNWLLPNPEIAGSFVIQRMDTNNEWIDIISIPANHLQQEYITTDNNPLSGYNSYRLRVNETNNTFSYSPVRRVWVGEPAETFSIFPNPASDKIIIRTNTVGQAEIKLYDFSGKIMMQKKIRLSNATAIDLPVLSPGVYILHINETVNKLVVR
jgi:hypothetical protein